MLQTRYFYVDEYSSQMEVLKRYSHRNLVFEKNEMMCRPGELLERCYLVTSGMAKMSVLHPSGKERAFGLWGPGSIYPIAITDNHFLLEEYIMLKAVNRVEAIAFDNETLRNIILENGEVSEAIINHYGRLTNLLIYSAVSEQFEPVSERLANFLYSCLVYMPTADNSIAFSQEEIASIIGTSRVSVSKELQEFKNRGILTIARGKICVLQKNALMARVGDYFRKNH